jgi:hypothetical protein
VRCARSLPCCGRHVEIGDRIACAAIRRYSPLFADARRCAPMRADVRRCAPMRADARQCVTVRDGML